MESVEGSEDSACANCGHFCQVKAGVSTKWWVKCPPIDGVSHFENLQSTNWNSLRFKNPPSAKTDIGWRVEFRPMDIQLTDFENTALTVMVGMIANIINTFDLDFVLPISLVDDNMKRAHLRDGLTEIKFWWKIPTAEQAKTGYRVSDINKTEFLKSNLKNTLKLGMSHEIARYKELYIWQILDGDAQVGMPEGIIALCQQFMDLKKWPAAKKAETNNYLAFLSERARGKILTGARFIRNFVT